MRKSKAVLNHLHVCRAIEMGAAIGKKLYDPNVINYFPVSAITTTGGGCHIPA